MAGMEGKDRKSGVQVFPNLSQPPQHPLPAPFASVLTDATQSLPPPLS
jgi:hypothetical protein